MAESDAEIVGPGPNGGTVVRLRGVERTIRDEDVEKFAAKFNARRPNHGAQAHASARFMSEMRGEPQPEREFSRQEPTLMRKAEAAGRGFTDTATLGFYDEFKGAEGAAKALQRKLGWKAGLVGAIPSETIQGAIARKIDPDAEAAYVRDRDAERSANASAAADAPGYHLAGSVGGIAPSLLMPVASGASVVKGAGVAKNALAVGSRIAAPAAQAGVEGAIRGVGAAKTMEEAPAEAAKSGGIGAFFGGLGGALGTAFPWLRAKRAAAAAAKASEGSDEAAKALVPLREQDAALKASEAVTTPDALGRAKITSFADDELAALSRREVGEASKQAAEDAAMVEARSLEKTAAMRRPAPPPDEAAKAVAAAGRNKAYDMYPILRQVAKGDVVDEDMAKIAAEAASEAPTALIPKNAPPRPSGQPKPMVESSADALKAAEEKLARREAAAKFSKDQVSEIDARLAKNRAERAALDPRIIPAERIAAHAEDVAWPAANKAARASDEVANVEAGLDKLGGRVKRVLGYSTAAALATGEPMSAATFGVLNALPPTTLKALLRVAGPKAQRVLEAGSRGAPALFAAHQSALRDDPEYGAELQAAMKKAENP